MGTGNDRGVFEGDILEVITLDPITKKFTQIIPRVKTCYICPSGDHVDDHHYDLEHGKISQEIIPLCRRCHRTIHMFRGIHMFDDIYLDRALEVFNKTQVLLNRQVIKREEIVRSKYWLKKHGIKGIKGINDESGSQTPIFKFNLPKGEPLCGQQWVNEHLLDLLDYIPRIEVVGPNVNIIKDIKSVKDLKEVGKVLKELKGKKGKRRNGKKRIITYDPIGKVFTEA